MEAGTPKTLKEAIERGACMSPAGQGLNTIHDHVIDYAAQIFGVLMMEAKSPQEEARVVDAWNKFKSKQKTEKEAV